MSAVVRHLLRRVAGHVVLLIAVTSCAYLLAAAVLDPRGNYERQSPPPPPEVVDAALAERNLNDRVPIGQRYLTWASGVVTGDLGATWDGRSVNEEMAQRVGASLRLVVLGAVLGSAAGVALGAWSGSRRYGWGDRFCTVGAVVVISVPVVVAAVVLQTAALWLNQALGVELLRTTGESTPGPVGGPWEGLADRARHLVLPTLALALPQAAVASRYQRALMAEAVSADFVRTARAKGLGYRTALRRHALRVALVPTFSYLGYSAAGLFAGAVLTEKVFGWHGVGSLLVDSVGRGDVNAVAAVCSFGALCVVAAAVLTDVAQAVLDPRTRAG